MTGAMFFCLLLLSAFCYGLGFGFLFLLVKKLNDLEEGKPGMRLTLIFIPVYIIFGMNFVVVFSFGSILSGGRATRSGLAEDQIGWIF